MTTISEPGSFGLFSHRRDDYVLSLYKFSDLETGSCVQNSQIGRFKQLECADDLETRPLFIRFSNGCITGVY